MTEPELHYEIGVLVSAFLLEKNQIPIAEVSIDPPQLSSSFSCPLLSGCQISAAIPNSEENEGDKHRSRYRDKSVRRIFSLLAFPLRLPRGGGERSL